MDNLYRPTPIAIDAAPKNPDTTSANVVVPSQLLIKLNRTINIIIKINAVQNVTNVPVVIRFS